MSFNTVKSDCRSVLSESWGRLELQHDREFKYAFSSSRGYLHGERANIVNWDSCEGDKNATYSVKSTPSQEKEEMFPLESKSLNSPRRSLKRKWQEFTRRVSSVPAHFLRWTKDLGMRKGECRRQSVGSRVVRLSELSAVGNI